MNVVVLGATGGTGRHTVKAALEAGHGVAAVARDPSALELDHERLRVVRGDVTSADSLAEHLAGSDALISALGSRASPREPVTLYSRAAEAMVEAMKRQGVRRLLVVTAGGYVRDPSAHLSFRFVVQPILTRVLRHTYDDMQRMERIVADSDLDWTVVRPARLTDGAKLGEYRTKVDGLVHRGGTISRADVGHFLVEQIASVRYLRQRVSIAY